MTKPESNYSRLEGQFFFGTGAEKGDVLLSSYRARQAYPKLAHLLRHHWEKDIEDHETYLRDQIDYLLSFYGILELALLTGMISEIPEAPRTRALANLSNPALRKYYEYNYPLILPQLLLRRLTGDLYLRERSDKDALNQFMRFLIITKTMDIDDDDMETFLWFLDDGDRDGYDYDDLVRALDQPRVFTEALTTPPDERDARDNAINGFRKFLMFCVEFNSLLAFSRQRYRLMAAEMYAHEAYWFVHVGEKVEKRVHKAIRKFSTNDSSGSPFRVQLSEAESAVGALLSGRYLEPLRKYQPIESFVRHVPKMISASGLKDEKAKAVGTLTPEGEEIIRVKVEPGSEGTLEELTQSFAVTRERIRQIEARALRKLRLSSRSRFLNGVSDRTRNPSKG